MRGLRHFLRYLLWMNGRTLKRHPWRVCAVLLGIALGAIAFTGVRLAVDASLDSFTQSMNLLSGKADWSVVRPGGRVQEDLVAELRNVPGLRGVSPVIMSYVAPTEANQEPFLLIGLAPILDRQFRDWQVLSGDKESRNLWLDLMRRPYTLVLSRRLATRLGRGPGDEIGLEHVHQAKRFHVLGILEPKGLALVHNGNIAVCDVATMQEFMGLHGKIDRIDLRFDNREDPKTMDQVKALLPPGTVVQPATARKDMGKELISSYQLNLSVLSFVSLFVGLFLVYSLVSINAASRRRDLAVFHSLGASSRLVFLLILSEGALLGILGWLIAIPAGRFLVKYWVAGIGNTINTLFVRVEVSGLQLDPWELVLSFLVTVLISAAGAYKPARQATRIQPREVMILEGGGGMAWRGPKVRTAVLGAVLVVAAWPLAELPLVSRSPIAGYVAVFSLIVGFSLLTLPFLQWGGERVPRVLRRLGGVPAFLAARYLRGVDERTSISVGAMVIAVSLFVSLAIMVHSFRETVTLWVNQTLSGDLFVRAEMAGMNQYRDPLPQDVVDAFQEFEVDAELMPYQRLYLEYRGIPYQLEAMALDVLFRNGDFMLLDKEVEEVRDALLAGKGVLVSEVFSNRTGLEVGETFRVRLEGEEFAWPVLAIARDYRTRGGAVFMDFGHFQEITGSREWGGVRFFFQNRDNLEASVEALRKKIILCCAMEHPLEILSGSQLRGEVLEIFDETFAVTAVLLLIALCIAGLGIAGTLTVLVMERSRQLNTLIAIGAGQGQLRRMVLWEAVLMVAAGEAIGLVGGLCLSQLLIYVINPQSFGWTFLYRVDWFTLAVSLPVILATALLAAVPATQSVMRLSPAGVLKEG